MRKKITLTILTSLLFFLLFSCLPNRNSFANKGCSTFGNSECYKNLSSNHESTNISSSCYIEESHPPFSFDESNTIELVKKEKLKYYSFQDGCSYGNLLFTFLADGTCYIFDIKTLNLVSETSLPSYNGMVPHSNSVCFGKKVDENEEFPLLYANIYNSYSSNPETYGLCFVYSIKRTGNVFSFFLEQTIKVSFTDDYDLWYDSASNSSPYGNFVVCDEKLIVFVNLLGASKTRFFEFDLPSVNFNHEVENVYLSKADATYHDLALFKYIQGCAFYNGFLLSLEGFGDINNPSFLRIVNIDNFVYFSFDLIEVVGNIEPESVFYLNGYLAIIDYAGFIYYFAIKTV